MWICPKCRVCIPDSKNICELCETTKPRIKENYCINPNCIDYKESLYDESQSCSKCGKLTLIGKAIEELT